MTSVAFRRLRLTGQTNSLGKTASAPGVPIEVDVRFARTASNEFGDEGFQFEIADSPRTTVFAAICEWWPHYHNPERDDGERRDSFRPCRVWGWRLRITHCPRSRRSAWSVSRRVRSSPRPVLGGWWVIGWDGDETAWGDGCGGMGAARLRCGRLTNLPMQRDRRSSSSNVTLVTSGTRCPSSIGSWPGEGPRRVVGPDHWFEMVRRATRGRDGHPRRVQVDCERQYAERGVWCSLIHRTRSL